MKYQFSSRAKLLVFFLSIAGFSFSSPSQASLNTEGIQDPSSIDESSAEEILEGILKSPEMLQLLEKARYEGLNENEFLQLKNEFMKMAGGPNIPFV